MAAGGHNGASAMNASGEGREGGGWGGYQDPKQLGNAAFRKRDFSAAVECFTLVCVWFGVWGEGVSVERRRVQEMAHSHLLFALWDGSGK